MGDGPQATVDASDVATTSPTRKALAVGVRPRKAMASTVARMMPASTSADQWNLASRW